MTSRQLAPLKICFVLLVSGCFSVHPKGPEPHRTKEQMVIHDLAADLACKAYDEEAEDGSDPNALSDYLGRIVEMCFHGTKSEMRKVMAQPDGYFRDYPFVFEILKDRKGADLEWKDLEMILPTDNNPRRMTILKHFINTGKATR